MVERRNFSRRSEVTVADFIGWMKTMSAYGTYVNAHSSGDSKRDDPLTELERAMIACMPPGDTKLKMDIPYFTILHNRARAQFQRTRR